MFLGKKGVLFYLSLLAISSLATLVQPRNLVFLILIFSSLAIVINHKHACATGLS